MLLCSSAAATATATALQDRGPNFCSGGLRCSYCRHDQLRSTRRLKLPQAVNTHQPSACDTSVPLAALVLLALGTIPDGTHAIHSIVDSPLRLQHRPHAAAWAVRVGGVYRCRVRKLCESCTKGWCLSCCTLAPAAVHSRTHTLGAFSFSAMHCPQRG